MTQFPAPSASATRPPAGGRPSVLIIGAGFGGIGAAIELQDHGYRDLTILEAAPRIGGTWHFNSYPGSACDIPSQMYSYSFAQRKVWTHLCAPQARILEYIDAVAAEHGIDRLVQTDTRVARCDWNATTQRWTATTAQGATHEADLLIVATGQLSQPHTPAIPGLDSFRGEQFHSARWNHDLPLHGRRIAVIGNGASAVQFVPEIAGSAAQLTVFQRTGNWFMARKNRPYPRLVQAWHRVPGVQVVRRHFVFQYTENITRSIRHPKTVGQYLRTLSWVFMRWQLRGDPELRRKVWPDYTFGCKRILFSSKWLPALRRPNVDLVTEPITAITATGVRTRDGREHEADTLIFATGFKATDFMLPMKIVGTGGVHLKDAWTGGAHAHLGMTVPGFPSLFIMYGPNTNTSGGSILIYLEAQAAYIRQAADLLARQGGGAIEVRPEVEARSDRELQERFGGTAWLSCNSWYRADGGRIVANWPGYMREYLSRTRVLDPTEFALTTPAPQGHLAATE